MAQIDMIFFFKQMTIQRVTMPTIPTIDCQGAFWVSFRQLVIYISFFFPSNYLTLFLTFQTTD